MILEKFDEFTSRKKSLKDKKKQLRKQLYDLGKQNLEIKKQEVAKKFNTYVNGASGFSKF
jgi:hypothetical protein